MAGIDGSQVAALLDFIDQKMVKKDIPKWLRVQHRYPNGTQVNGHMD